MRYWDCWKTEPLDPSISPCGYADKGTDPACRGCADDPRKARDKEVEVKFRKTQQAWAKNMERARKQLEGK